MTTLRFTDPSSQTSSAHASIPMKSPMRSAIVLGNTTQYFCIDAPHSQNQAGADSTVCGQLTLVCSRHTITRTHRGILSHTLLLSAQGTQSRAIAPAACGSFQCHSGTANTGTAEVAALQLAPPQEVVQAGATHPTHTIRSGASWCHTTNTHHSYEQVYAQHTTPCHLLYSMQVGSIKEGSYVAPKDPYFTDGKLQAAHTRGVQTAASAETNARSEWKAPFTPACTGEP